MWGCVCYSVYRKWPTHVTLLVMARSLSQDSDEVEGRKGNEVYFDRVRLAIGG